MEHNFPARTFYEKMGMLADGCTTPSEIGGTHFLEVRYALSL